MIHKFDLKQIEEIANNSGMEVLKRERCNTIQLMLPEIAGIIFYNKMSRIIITFGCCFWDKNIDKRKYIVTGTYSDLLKTHTGEYTTCKPPKNMFDRKAEKDPVKFCKHMLQKTINKAKLLRKNAIRKAGAKYELV